MGNRIEVAKSGRSKCVTCNEVIPKGTPRLSEETSDIGIPDLIHRFYHLKCAAAVHPEVVAAALQHVDHGVVFDRAEIEAKIAPAVQRAQELRKAKYLAQQAEKEAKTKAVIVEADETTNELLSQLDASPEDPGTLAVVADQLQARGDIRGELIALQLAMASGAAPPLPLDGDDDEETDAADLVSESERRSRRCAQLFEKLAIPLDPGDKCIWGIGFIRRLELLRKNGTRLSALEPIWRHPSLRFLSELRLTFSSNLDTSYVARLDALVPRSLRRLELGDDGDQALAGTAVFIAQLPRLEALLISGKAYATAKERFAHPTLRRLELGTLQRSPGGDLVNLIPFLAPKALPAVDALVIRPGTSVVEERYRNDELGHFATSLAARGWFKRLAHFGWVQGDPITDGDATQLAEALGKRKLAKLDLTGTKVPLALRDKLARMCTELVAPDLAVSDDQTIYVEHANKPEWGRGKLVRRNEGKLEVEFPKPIGKKVFKADAPFLKMLA